MSKKTTTPPPSAPEAPPPPAPAVETKTYADGTTATGVAPLPDQSPTEQASDVTADLAAAVSGNASPPTPPTPTRDQLDNAIANLNAEDYAGDPDYAVNSAREYFGTLFTDADEAAVRAKLGQTSEPLATTEKAPPAPISLVPPAVSAALAAEAVEPMVETKVPEGFNLTLSHDRTVRYEKSHAQMMPESHARHWYAKAQGVLIKGEDY